MSAFCLTWKAGDTYVISAAHDLIVVEVDGRAETVTPETGAGRRLYQARARVSSVHAARHRDNEHEREADSKVAAPVASPAIFAVGVVVRREPHTSASTSLRVSALRFLPVSETTTSS